MAGTYRKLSCGLDGLANGLEVAVCQGVLYDIDNDLSAGLRFCKGHDHAIGIDVELDINIDWRWLSTGFIRTVLAVFTGHFFCTPLVLRSGFKDFADG